MPISDLWASTDQGPDRRCQVLPCTLGEYCAGGRPPREDVPVTTTPDPDRPAQVPAVTSGRIPSGTRRELGLPGWLFCKLTARVWGVPEFHLFTALAQHRRLFWSWIPFSGVLLYRGRLPKYDTEAVILRVGHLRGCA